MNNSVRVIKRQVAHPDQSLSPLDAESDAFLCMLLLVKENLGGGSLRQSCISGIQLTLDGCRCETRAVIKNSKSSQKYRKGATLSFCVAFLQIPGTLHVLHSRDCVGNFWVILRKKFRLLEVEKKSSKSSYYKQKPRSVSGTKGVRARIPLPCLSEFLPVPL